ncbi:MAG: site-2 protease family protein [Pseudomonadota bacterium]
MITQELITKIAIILIPLIFAITVHEVAHGWVASKFGDQTAKMLGRLTLNPVKHIDILGTIIVPIILLALGGFIFGWAKPVPISPRNFKNPRPMMAIVAVAGPVSNLIMAILWAIVAKIGLMIQADNTHLAALTAIGFAGITINAFIGVLNLLPIPPLDGGRIVSNILPPKLAYYYDKLEPFGFYILIILIITGILSHILLPITLTLIHSIAALFGIL